MGKGTAGQRDREGPWAGAVGDAVVRKGPWEDSAQAESGMAGGAGAAMLYLQGPW